MRQLLSQSQRLVNSLQSLVWIAQNPQDPGHIEEAAHLGVLQSTRGATFLGIVESNRLFQVLSGQGKLSKPEQNNSQHVMGVQTEDRSVEVLGQAQVLLCQLMSPLALRPV